ncbi:MAG: hypothetical protein KME16_04140 [Scytolyngbya sp. HA4215-MV1]|nr:hypothetical protein [Scytolyngbya sp. HA4215-MV1]
MKNPSIKGKSAKVSPGQKSLWDEWNAPVEEIRSVAEKFVLANCYNSEAALTQMERQRCQVTKRQNPDSS